MPKTEHWQWYVEEFSPTEMHHHALEETYHSGRTDFQSVAVVRSATFGKMLIIDGDTQSSQADERIYHETLVHPALAAASDRSDVLVLGGGEGRPCARCCAAPTGARARWSTSRGKSSSCRSYIFPNGVPAHGTIPARASSSAMR